MIIGCALLGLAIVLGVAGRKSRVTLFAVFIICLILMGLNTNNADFAGYQFFYDAKMEEWSGLNPGYVAAEKIGWALGLDYIQFRMLFSGLGLLLIADTARRYTKNSALVMALYITGAFFYDVVQFKFFLASSVAIFALRYLIDQKKLFLVWYSLSMLLAFSIHPAAILFCLFAIGLFDRRRAFVASATLTVIFILLVYSGIASVLLSSVVDATKAEAYFTAMSRFGSMPYLISVILQVLIVYWTHLETHGVDTFVNEVNGLVPSGTRFVRFYENAVYALLPLAALIPLSVQNFYRPIRSATFLLFIYVSIAGFDEVGNYSKRARTTLVFLFIVWLIFTDFITYSGVAELVVAMELQNNLLWQ